ncbi:2,3-diaminopropionate biosynthesis protein SbnA [Kutzneria buriramensis]|uniref:Cysteine synthase A n=1 Tax=Kutzneria buriramensis TaxID=1045776 RepID=A0A3E0HQ03_9PSEU|nr:2,3-diaminopropionate biosynthesis protein SbnA [Kutzneria buriramensis]REH48498.1 cysteine synthase A [Kutzneria buriramensis]
MPVITTPQEFNVPDLFVDLGPSLGIPLYLKCEGFNFAGSIKLKAATEMIDAAEREGLLGPGAMLVESSSGNMGVALSLVALGRGYRFTCVTDVRCTQTARSLMRALGAHVHVVSEPDAVAGFLGARLRQVARMCAEHDDYVWLNQYSNQGNWMAHRRTTGPEILRAFPELDVLFVGAGTTGTLMGCARYLREARPSARIVAIDSVGSVTFGRPAGPRLIPGLGTGVRPALLNESLVDDVLHVAEPDTVRACRSLARQGFLFGGSTGSVVAGAAKWLADNDSGGITAVAVAPDLGERYLDTVYEDQWVAQAFGAQALDEQELTGVGTARALRSAG